MHVPYIGFALLFPRIWQAVFKVYYLDKLRALSILFNICYVYVYGPASNNPEKYIDHTFVLDLFMSLTFITPALLLISIFFCSLHPAKP